MARRIARALRAAKEPYAMLIMPDHPTPIAMRTHTSDPVPFLLYRSTQERPNGAPCYDEEAARQTGLILPRACEMMRAFLR